MAEFNLNNVGNGIAQNYGLKKGPINEDPINGKKPIGKVTNNIFDLNKDGEVTVDDLISIANIINKAILPIKKEPSIEEPPVADVPPSVDDSQVLDANGDGIITKHEMLNYGSNLINSNPWDKNGDNDVEFNEQAGGAPTVMVELTDEEAKKCADAGFKVYNNHIDYSAYQEYKYYNEDISGSLDTNNDGVVSDSEVLKPFMAEHNSKIQANAIEDYLTKKYNLNA